MIAYVYGGESVSTVCGLNGEKVSPINGNVFSLFGTEARAAA